MEKLPLTIVNLLARTAGRRGMPVSSQGETLTISAIIPAHQGGNAFARSLRSVLQADPKPDEVLVVADGSPEAAGEARALGARGLRGPASARTPGPAHARGDIIALVDADVLIRPEFFSRIAALFQTEPD